ncbi:MAG: tetratricopeptide repeat protein [Bacteroidota bacterium]
MRCLLLVLLLASGTSAQAPVDTLETAARAAALSGDTALALDLLTTADTLSAEARTLLARLALDAGQPLVALDALADADTTDAAAHLVLGRAYATLGDASGAEVAYRYAHRQRPGGTATVALAALVAQRKPLEAVGLYRLLVARDSLNPAHHGALGRVYADLDSVPLARVHLSRSFDLYPQSERVALALAELLEEEPEAIAAHLTAALEANPESADLWRARGAAAIRADALPLAVEAYRTALRLSDSTAVRLRGLGVALYYAGETPEALEVFREAYARDSTDATTLRLYGLAAYAEGNTPLALDLLTRAADAMGRRALADLYESRARIHLEQMQEDDALAWLDLSGLLAPEKDTVELNRAVVYQQFGRLSEAELAYRAFAERTLDDRLRDFALDRAEMLAGIEQDRVEADLRRRLGE